MDLKQHNNLPVSPGRHGALVSPPLAGDGGRDNREQTASTRFARTGTHTHTRKQASKRFQIIPWCHRSYFTNNGPHVCSGLQGCVRQEGLGSVPSLKPRQDHCKFLLVFSSCNLRARCAGDCGASGINSL